MATLTGKIVADFTTTLASALAVGATSGSLQSATDDDNVALPAGTYYFTIDGSNSSKEHIRCTLSGTTISSIYSISRQGAATSGTARAHRLGATVTLTDFAHLKIINDLINGTTDLDADNPLAYDAEATLTPGSDQLATVKYADALSIAGAADGTTTTKGIFEEATQAEIDADTAAGGTSARLAINPSTLATSKYGTRLPSADEKTAIAGKSGTAVGSGNKLIDEDYTAEANTASKIPVRDSNGDVLVASTPTNTNAATPKNYVDKNTGKLTYPMGEAFTGATTPQAAILINDLIQPLANDWLASGKSGTNPQRWGIKITPRTALTVESVRLILAQVGSDSDSTQVVIEGDSAGSPDGSVITNGTSASIADTTLSTTTGTLMEYTFSTPPSLSADTPYWFILEVTGVLQASAYELVAVYDTTSEDYASFDGKYYNGSSWVDAGLMAIEVVPATGGSKSLWLSDADHANDIMQSFSGVVTTTGSAGDDATLHKAGIVPGFSSFQQYADYYLGTTAGALDPDNSNVGMYVGEGYSSTELYLTHGKRKGQPIHYGTIGTSFGEGDGMVGIWLKAPCDGVWYLDSTVTATLDMQIRLSFDGTTSNNIILDFRANVSSGETQAFPSIPVRKGTYLNISSSNANPGVLYFQPIID